MQFNPGQRVPEVPTHVSMHVSIARTPHPVANTLRAPHGDYTCPNHHAYHVPRVPRPTYHVTMCVPQRMYHAYLNLRTIRTIHAVLCTMRTRTSTPCVPFAPSRSAVLCTMRTRTSVPCVPFAPSRSNALVSTYPRPDVLAISDSYGFTCLQIR